MKKKSLIVDDSIGTIVGLFLLVTAVAVPSVNAYNNCLSSNSIVFTNSDR